MPTSKQSSTSSKRRTSAVKKPKNAATNKSPQPRAKKRADQYDSGNYNYLKYWDGRDYEHAAEELAIRRLLKGRRFKHAVDIGGGYGRLCVLLEEFSDKVTLAEPSKTQLDIAKDYLQEYPEIDRKLMQADDLKFDENSVDLVTMIRVMHHLPDPSKEFAEIARVLHKDGYLVLEIANYAHGRNRIKHALKGQKLPVQPVDIRSEENQRADEVAFVNHNPKTVVKQLAHAGLKAEKVLSVSNLRSPGLKKVMPMSIMVNVERLLQPALAKTYFGPSVFLLVRRVK
jgi:ubiquinone/menaquinone biosynthesis C-methylase UbiE